jgi:hypothetical protein
VNWVSDIGYLASALVFTSFCMRTMIPLRIAAICSNLAFICYGTLGGIYPVLILHCLLLPMNLWRTSQTFRMIRSIKGAAVGDGVSNWLLPFLKFRRCQAGEVLFRIDDPGDRLFLILDGQVLLEGTDMVLTSGMILGEMALFSASQRRTQTARCLTAAELGWITRDEIAQLCFRNPAIAFHFLSLMTKRLTENMEKLQAAQFTHARAQDLPPAAAEI